MKPFLFQLVIRILRLLKQWKPVRHFESLHMDECAVKTTRTNIWAQKIRQCIQSTLVVNSDAKPVINFVEVKFAIVYLCRNGTVSKLCVQVNSAIFLNINICKALIWVKIILNYSMIYLIDDIHRMDGSFNKYSYKINKYDKDHLYLHFSLEFYFLT